jgi:superfamily II DNA or RNA helicase
MKREEIQELALKATEGKNNCGLGLATGVGKTLVGLTHMARNHSALKNILVVAPKKSIFASWRYEAEKFNLGHVLTNATFTTYLSLHKKDPNEYDLVYLDECHSLLDSHRKFLENFNGKILGLTGTPPKHQDSDRGQLVNQFCPIVYSYLTDDAIDDNILNDYKIIVHQLKLSNKPNIEVNTKGKSFFTSEVNNYAYWCNRLDNCRYMKETQIARVMRMKAMMEFPSKEKYAKLLTESIKSKCIIFANTQDQADRLCKNSYHSNNSNSDHNLNMFKKGDISKLSCVLQLSEGVNIPDLKQSIILHSYGNERKATQRIGRCLRLNPDETATIHVLCYMGTVDEKWVTDALEGFSSDKITWKDYNIKLD